MEISYYIKVDPTLMTKYQLFDSDWQPLASLKVNPLFDFYDSLLGWLLPIPLTWNLKLAPSANIQLRRHFGLLNVPYQISVDDGPTATVQRAAAFSHRNFLIASNGRPSTVMNHNPDGSAFAIVDEASKIPLLRCRKLPGAHFNYQVNIWDQLNQGLLLGILLAVLNANRR